MVCPRLLLVCLALFATADAAEPELRGVEGKAVFSSAKLMESLAAKRVVFVGESHERPDHHKVQLDIIRAMHKANPELAIGVEQVQRAFQRPVDEYIAGRIDESEFLRQTEYYERWRYDYRLYASIFRFARENKIPVVALNVPTALSRAVAKAGIGGLTDELKKDVPKEMDKADEAYRARLKKAFDSHAPGQTSGFDKFLEAQLIWDEGMAESASIYLNANPAKRMVVIAGAGHIAHGAGIPKRVERRTKASWASVLVYEAADPDSTAADYVVFSNSEEELPPAGKLGVEFETHQPSGVRLKSVDAKGGAAKAHLRAGDVVTAIDGKPVTKTSDARVLLWEKTPGDSVKLTVRRKGRFGGIRSRTVAVVLSSL